MMRSPDDAYRIGRLLQWGLRTRDRPAQEPEYAELVDDYLNRAEFRAAVRETARGLGILILDASEHGIVLAPDDESVFALAPASFRSHAGADDRLLDGLVQVAIATTVFPRARDLEEDPDVARPPLTIDEVEDQLRLICTRLDEEARSRPDPETSDEASGLYEAWRVYQQRLAILETKDDRRARRSTRRIIEHNLDRLREFGCFMPTRTSGPLDDFRPGAGRSAWQPSRRYQVLVQELAASRLFEELRAVLERAESVAGEGD